jgi:diaminohydroxyphosphoribosylaminopyrimidine deaminase/5-amino-6-(5-phosphoribosylamino)uracil reductase
VGVDCAPLLIGGKEAPGPLGGEGFPSLDHAARLEHLDFRRYGGDVVFTGYQKGRIGKLKKRVDAPISLR